MPPRISELSTRVPMWERSFASESLRLNAEGLRDLSERWMFGSRPISYIESGFESRDNADSCATLILTSRGIQSSCFV
jgi:hypothetical protein